jgi:hypothetical protein
MFDILDRTSTTIARLGEDLALGVKQKDCGEPCDSVFFEQRTILSFEFFGQFLFVREVEFYKHELLWSLGLEGLLVVDFLP